ncbi:hypothetical protein Hanom_Chr04g00299571 [Helianthus anomalus]
MVWWWKHTNPYPFIAHHFSLSLKITKAKVAPKCNYSADHSSLLPCLHSLLLKKKCEGKCQEEVVKIGK